LWIVAVIAICVAVVAASVAVIVVKVAGSQAVASVTLEPASSPGPNPFTNSVASGPTVNVAGNALAESGALRKTLPSDQRTHTLVATGTAPGLYGGSGDVHVCDPQKLVAFLTQHQDKAAAWSGVLGIAPKNIASYVATLTPVLLTSDTLVGNHGFQGGVATSELSVLQAGTAVMVDATGTPRVKCNCGNPLTPPELITLSKANTRGTAWPGYTPAAVTAVRPGPATATLTLVDVGTGQTYEQSTASGAGLWVAAETTNTSGAPAPEQTTIVTSSDGRLWSPAGVIPFNQVQALAWGNGTWIAAVPVGNSTLSSILLESTDLRTWRPVMTLPDTILGVAYGNGRWTAVGNLASGPVSAVVWGSTDGVHWVRVASSSDGNAVFTYQLSSVAYGNGQWIAVGSQGSSVPGLKTFTSSDGISWAANGGIINGATGPGIAYGAGQWTITAITNTETSSQSAAGQHVVVGVSMDGRSWVAKPILGVSGAVNEGDVAYGNGKWLAAADVQAPTAGGTSDGSIFFGSGDAKTWSPMVHVAQSVDALAFGSASSVSGTTETSPSSTATTPSGTSTSTNPPTSPSSPAGANIGATFAGTWGAHETGLVINKAGTGDLHYQDLSLCPSCSFANAPPGTLVFVLTSLAQGVATGNVTATSDPKNYAMGATVHVSLTAGSPGQILNVVIGGRLSLFCNSTSVGQCGA